MRFLIDAQLPRRLVHRLEESGYDAIHTLDLPDKNQTTDTFLEAVSIRDQRIVITKDSDFVNSFLLYSKPYKLLLISTGNISNQDLERLILSHIQQIIQAFEDHRFIELHRRQLVIHS